MKKVLKCEMLDIRLSQGALVTQSKNKQVLKGQSQLPKSSIVGLLRPALVQDC